VRLSLIVTTAGRPTLAATLRSILIQTTETDQVIVLSDGSSPAARRMLAQAAEAEHAPVPQLVEHPRVGGRGGRLRNYALDHLVDGTHVAAIDDDDVYVPGALRLFREAAGAVPSIFRMRYGAGHHACGLVLWQVRRVAFANVGTPMVVAPVSSARFGPGFAGDLVYCEQLLAEFRSVEWRPEIVAEIRPGAPGAARP
jgi:glycosyltransferase involved in cell wall biosynthesis